MTATQTRRCVSVVHPKVSIGIMSKGTESFRLGPPRQCSRAAVEGSCHCAQHAVIAARIDRVLAARRERTL